MNRRSFAAVRRPTPVARSLARVLAVAALLVIGACSELLPPPIPTEEDRFDLVANAPVAGAQIEALLEVGVALVSVEPLRDDVWVRAVTRDDRIHVAWIGLDAVAGPQVRVTLARTTPDDDPPALLVASSYASGEGDDLGASVLRWRSADDADAFAAEGTMAIAGTPADGRLEAWFAGYGLGDLSRSGAVEVQDALVLLDLFRYGGWDDFERYHGDLDGDGVLGGADLEALLEKVVDPELPAVLRVKPEELSFAQLAGVGTDPSVVLVANGGRLPFSRLDWTPPDGVTATTVGGVAGQSVALEVALPSANRLGWRPGFLLVSDDAGGGSEVRLGHLVALVAGQSNAVGWGLPVTGWPEVPSARVRMLGNDYRWGPAVEPLDSASDQRDEVSEDPEAKYSFGTRLGNLLLDATGFASYLLPSAKGGSRVTLAPESGGWSPGAPTDRATLFGSAVFRSRVSAGLETNPVGGTSEGGPVNVVLWYQGESDASDATRRGGFVDGTRTVMNGFWSQLQVPIVYVQLASHEYGSQSLQQAWIAEQQRRLETGSGHPSGALIDAPHHHMVVAFDLPRSDHIHLSAYGQRLLAERLDLAVREHVLGEDVDGTGPRLTAIDWDGGTVVTLRTTRTLRDGPIVRAYVTVFDGPPNGVVNPTDLPTGSNTVAVSSVARDPTDPTAIRITLASPPSSEPYVLYVAPPGIPATNSPTVGLIRAADGIGVADLGLPLPAFGPLPPY